MEALMPALFSPITIGPYRLKHRVVMAPLTRMRSGAGNVPTALMREYYEQRASDGGLIVSEATPVSLTGYGYAGAPGIYDDRQISGWKAITDAVHAKGGRIFLQLWHVGRQSHNDLQPGGAAPVAPSAIRAEGLAYTDHGPAPFSMPRELRLDEIVGLIEDYRQGAERALIAGFDGVEVHGANGYLPDQFLQDGTNHRTDAYGGSLENRARFMLEVTEAAISVWGEDRVGVRLSPSGDFGSMWDSDPLTTFGYVANSLSRLGLAYLHVIEPRIRGNELIAANEAPVAAKHLRPIFKGPLIAAGGFDRNSAMEIVEDGIADLVAFGRFFISNPDLPLRLQDDFPLNAYDRDTFYGGGRKGYVDYPFYGEADDGAPTSPHADHVAASIGLSAAAPSNVSER
jgi:N-ethylmaleimide reductase